MAEKSFGVKEINFVGSTPKINSLSNLNLNAVNVAISTNATIGGNLTVSGTVGIAGTLTYEDVTNIDSVGLITARSGIDCNGDIDVDGHTNLDNVSIAGVTTFGNNITASGTSRFEIASMENALLDGEIAHTGDTNTLIKFPSNDNISFDTSGTTRLNINNSGATVTGTLSATTFSGSGASLTGVAVTEAPVTDYTITGDGSHYYFHGGGVDETAGDPDLYLIRGQKYRFNNTTGSSHPFEFRAVSNGSPYTNGVTGDDEGVQFFTVPYDAPAKIFYICTVHSGMVGNIYIRGAGGQNDNIGVTTFTGRVTISSAAPNLLFTETDANPDWGILCSGGQMKFQDLTNVANILTLDDDKIQAVKNLDAMAGVDVTSGDLNIGSSVGRFDSSGIIKTAHGTESAPSHTFINDNDNGMYRPTTNTLGFVCGGDEKLRIDSSGRLLVNTTTGFAGDNTMIIAGESPSGGTYDLYDGQLLITSTETSGAVNTGGAIQFYGHDGGSSRGFGSIRCLKENGTSGNHNAYMAFLLRVNGGNPTERLRIMSDGKVGIGITNPSARLEVRDNASTGIIVRCTSTQTTDSNKALRVRNNSDTNVLSVSHKGLLEIARGELGTYLKIGGDNASNGRALTFTSSTGNTGSNGALHTINATSGNGAIALATAGTENFRVDRDGYVTKPNNAMFKVQRTSNQSVSSIGWHIIQFNNDSTNGCFDVGGNFTTSNHRFTAPVNGYYHFGLNQRIDGGNTSYYRVAFSVDGGIGDSQNYPYGHAIYKDSDGFSFYSFSITTLLYLTAGQYVRAEAYSHTDTSWTLQDESIFYGYLVG